MIIDNKQSYGSSPNIKTVWDTLLTYTDPTGRFGQLDIVTGFFSIAALHLLYQELSEKNTYRIVLGDLLDMRRDNDFLKKAVDLLQGDSDLENAFQLSYFARNAVAFLKRETVHIRTINNAFCHAKAYIFEDKMDAMHDYGIVGSSNLTEAGLGRKESSNIELNMVETGRENATVKELKQWFDDLWKHVASSHIVLQTDKGKNRNEDAKAYLIKQIEQIFKAYTPEQIYHKILFEFFRADIEMNESLEYRRDMEFLQKSKIWQELYEFQKSGVVSLVKLLTQYGGAILADAVGLGKTFSALGVIKYFQNNGYHSLILCPKKLRNNWLKYRVNRNSKFEEDHFQFIVRSHTDLQENRLNNYDDGVTKEAILSFDKLLVVVDESHNLRNDKSCRYRMLLDEIINESAKRGHTVKVLLLSATPINTGLIDIRNQFNMIGYPENQHFYEEFHLPAIETDPLRTIFQQANLKFSEWSRDPRRSVNSLREKLSLVNHFFKLTDELIIARNRAFVTRYNKELHFPVQLLPQNEHVPVNNIGDYRDIDAMYDDMKILRLTAYQPTQYNHKLDVDCISRANAILKMVRNGVVPEEGTGLDEKDEKLLFKALKSVSKESKSEELQQIIMQNWIVKQSIKKENDGKIKWDDNALRELSLAGMMISLFIKRLESSWTSCLSTLETVRDVHQKWLEHAEKRENAVFDDNDTATDKEEDIETVGKRPVNFKQMLRVEDYIADLKRDIAILDRLIGNLKKYETAVSKGERTDEKLDTLMQLLAEKQKCSNPKVVIFTSYTDTAGYLYEHINSEFDKVALVTGDIDNNNVLERTLQQFAPYSKLFLELKWDDLYKANGINNDDYKGRNGELYEIWKDLVSKSDNCGDIRNILSTPIDILVATDCISEGQNLQDADLVINYDIHWNPVRLIQRFGRIDRIGSPNANIQSVNFWPSNDIESYLGLSERVSNRMVAMNVAGSETLQANEQIALMEEGNQFRESQDARSLRSIHDDKVGQIEDMETPTFDVLSLSEFKADAEEYAQQHLKELEQMPNGAFSGFRWNMDKYVDYPECLVALLRHREDTKSFHLLCLPANPKGNTTIREMDKAEVLQLLSEHKNEDTFLPQEIMNADVEALKRLSGTIKNWFKPKDAVMNTITNLLKGSKDQVVNANPDESIEQRTDIGKYDLIAWDYISKMKHE